MADVVGTAKLKITWVLTIASTAAPTAAELNAGTDIQTVVIKDGLDEKHDQEAVDNTHIASAKETERAGTSKDEMELTIKKQAASVDDIGYNTLVPEQLGNLVIRRDKLHTTAYAAGDVVSIYPSECGVRNWVANKMNEPLQYKQKLFNHTAGQDAVTVV